MQVRFTEDAEADFHSVFRYIAEDNPARAGTFVEELEAFTRKLGRHPDAHPRALGIATNSRRAIFGNYNVYYTIVDGTVVVFGIIHGRRRQRAALRGRHRR